MYFKRDNGSVSYVSMGYRAKWVTATATQYGFVTCVHVPRKLQDKIYYENSTKRVVATSRPRGYGNGLDASFTMDVNFQK